MSDDTQVVVLCPTCRAEMVRMTCLEATGETPRIETYQCQRGDCRRRPKLAVIHEFEGFTPEVESFVRREVARTGAFFPSDFTGRNREMGGGLDRGPVRLR